MSEAILSLEYQDNNLVIVTIVGKLDHSNVEDKFSQIEQVMTRIPEGLKLLFNFKGLEYIDSKSIGYLTNTYQNIVNTKGKVALACLRPNINDIFQVVGITQMLEVFDTVDEAKAYLMQEEE